MNVRLDRIWAGLWLYLLCRFALPLVVQAQLPQFGYKTNNGTITITGCTNCFGNVAVPSTINGLPVASIGLSAFEGRLLLTGVVIPDSVTNISPRSFYSCPSLGAVSLPNTVRILGSSAFERCDSLRQISIPTSVQRINNRTFALCTSLTNVMIPNSVTNIGADAFEACFHLSSVVIPDSVTSIEGGAFYDTGLLAVYFWGNAPELGLYAFGSPSILYYLSGNLGWEGAYFERPTAPWLLPNPLILTKSSSFGLQTNAFGFRVSWATNTPVVVEACADLATPVWTPLSTNSLAPSGWFQFSDPEWTNYPSRIYRVRSQ